MIWQASIQLVDKLCKAVEPRIISPSATKIWTLPFARWIPGHLQGSLRQSPILQMRWDQVPTRSTLHQRTLKTSISHLNFLRKSPTGPVWTDLEACNLRHNTRSVLDHTRQARSGPNARTILSSWMPISKGSQAKAQTNHWRALSRRTPPRQCSYTIPYQFQMVNRTLTLLSELNQFGCFQNHCNFN